MGAFAHAIMTAWLGPDEDYQKAALLMLIFTLPFQIHIVTGPATSIFKGMGKPQGETVYPVIKLLLVVLFSLIAYLIGGWSILSIGIAVALDTGLIVPVIKDADRLSLGERTMAKLRQLKLDPRAMRRYDANGDGQIDQIEWEAARSDAEQMTLKEHLAEQGERKRQEDHVVIARPPQRRLPFVIAETASEAHLTAKYGWFSIPLLLGGVVALVFAIVKFLQFMRI
jgi:hypothetical protein